VQSNLLQSRAGTFLRLFCDGGPEPARIFVRAPVRTLVHKNFN